MKLGEVIQRVQSPYSRGVQSRDSRLTSRHIYSAISSARSILIRQQYNKNQKISQWAYQPLHCIELIQAPIHECSCIPNSGCIILRSKYKIPAPISGIDKHLIQSVTSLDGELVFDESDFKINKYMSGNKYTANKPDYYFRNEYLYITVLKQLKAITITALFHDIVAVKQFKSYCSDCPDCECVEIMDIDYPIDEDLVKPLVDIANQELIYLMKQMSEDKSNNSSDDTNTSNIVHQPQEQ